MDLHMPNMDGLEVITKKYENFSGKFFNLKKNKIGSQNHKSPRKSIRISKM
jgi:hypothetical protein